MHKNLEDFEQSLSQTFDRDYFEGAKSNYGAQGGYWDYPVFDAVAAMVKEAFDPQCLLDAGCAKGYLVKHLRKRGVSAYGTDISPYAVAESPEDIRPYLTAASLHRLPFTDNHFDTVVSMEVMEHIPKELLLMSIRELKRVCSGRLFLTIAQVHDTTDTTHVSLYPMEMWVKLFMSQGLFFDETLTEKVLSYNVVKQFKWQPYVFSLKHE